LAGYLLSSFMSGRLIAWLSMRGLLTLSCALFGAALIGDCLVPAWIWFALTSLALGFGAGGIDAGLNTYVATHFGARQMHWLHACFGVGVTLGPLLMTASLNRLDGWRPAYLALGLFQLAMAAVFIFSTPLWNRFHLAGRRPGQGKKLTDYDTPLMKTMAHLPTWLGMILFFLYSGAEFSLGFWAYSLLTESRGVTPTVAGMMTGSYWGLFTVGRILSGFFAKHVPLNRMVLGCLVLALAGSVLLWINLNPVWSLLGMVLTGFAIAPIFPSLVSGTQKRVGRRHASNTIGMQMCAAGAGSAFISAVLGLMARRMSLEVIPASLTGLWVMILLLFIGSIRRERKNRGRVLA
jgi:fucose permease